MRLIVITMVNMSVVGNDDNDDNDNDNDDDDDDGDDLLTGENNEGGG